MTTIQTATPIYSVELYVEHCFSCGIAFGLPKGFQRFCERDKTTFYCPNGHRQTYIHSTEERLRREIESRDKMLRLAQDDIAYWRQRTADVQGSLTATKGHLTRVKRRAEAGVCIHCNRTFANVARHMQTQHVTSK